MYIMLQSIDNINLNEIQEELKQLKTASDIEQKSRKTESAQITNTLKTMTDTIKSQQYQLSEHGREIRNIQNMQAAQLAILQEILHNITDSKTLQKIGDAVATILETVTQSQSPAPHRPSDTQRDDDSTAGTSDTKPTDPSDPKSSLPRGGVP